MGAGSSTAAGGDLPSARADPTYNPGGTMRAVVFTGEPGKVEVRDVPVPVLEEPGDVVVRVLVAGVCGSDLHPLSGKEPCDAGTVFGHEAVGEVVARGDGVPHGVLPLGSRVVLPFTTACGGCYFCLAGLSARCAGARLFGWRLGGVGLHGCQAEYVRVPTASTTLVPLPRDLAPEEGLLLGDIWTTALFAAANAGLAGAHPDGSGSPVGALRGLLAAAGMDVLATDGLAADDGDEDEEDEEEEEDDDYTEVGTVGTAEEGGGGAAYDSDADGGGATVTLTVGRHAPPPSKGAAAGAPASPLRRGQGAASSAAVSTPARRVPPLGTVTRLPPRTPAGGRSSPAPSPKTGPLAAASQATSSPRPFIPALPLGSPAVQSARRGSSHRDLLAGGVGGGGSEAGARSRSGAVPPPPLAAPTAASAAGAGVTALGRGGGAAVAVDASTAATLGPTAAAAAAAAAPTSALSTPPPSPPVRLLAPPVLVVVGCGPVGLLTVVTARTLLALRGWGWVVNGGGGAGGAGGGDGVSPLPHRPLAPLLFAVDTVPARLAAAASAGAIPLDLASLGPAGVAATVRAASAGARDFLAQGRAAAAAAAATASGGGGDAAAAADVALTYKPQAPPPPQLLPLGDDGTTAAVVWHGCGADAVMEAVGSPSALRLAWALARPGGTLSSVGVHTSGVADGWPAPPGGAYDKNLTLRCGRCPARSLMPLAAAVMRVYNAKAATDARAALAAAAAVSADPADPAPEAVAAASDALGACPPLRRLLFTHRLPLGRAVRAYATFAARGGGCVKVALYPDASILRETLAGLGPAERPLPLSPTPAAAADAGVAGADGDKTGR